MECSKDITTTFIFDVLHSTSNPALHLRRPISENPQRYCLHNSNHMEQICSSFSMLVVSVLESSRPNQYSLVYDNYSTFSNYINQTTVLEIF